MRLRLTIFALLALLSPGTSFATPVWTEAGKAQALMTTAQANTADARATIGQLAKILQLAPAVAVADRKSTRLNSSHVSQSRMPSSA